MKKLLAFVLICLALWGCRTVMEKDIQNDIVQVNSPSDGFRSGVFYQTFYWERLDGASSYRIQISAGNFTDSLNLVTDSTTTSTQYSTSLGKGIYQWRVAGVNYGYTSQWCPIRTITIDSTGDIGAQIIELTSPGTTPTNESTIVFSWKYLPQANSYNFKLDSAGINILATNVTGPTFSRKFPKDGSYKWSVQGVDSRGISSGFSSRDLITDFTKPIVSLTEPANKSAYLGNVVTFKWNVAEINGLNVHQLLVYKDSSSSSSLYSDAFPRSVAYLNQGAQSDTFKLTDLNIKKIWWKVKATDKAGNPGESELRSLTIQP